MEIEKRLRAGEDLQDIVKKKPTEVYREFNNALTIQQPLLSAI